MYSPEFDSSWKLCFESLDRGVQLRIVKKIKQILDGLPGRHLEHGADYFVEEVGQYRICYKSFEDRKARRFYFVGIHKEYEKWYSSK